MAKKSKHMTGKPFSVEVCDAIRHHIGERKVLDSKRTTAFEDRDAAVEEKSGIDNHDGSDYLEACKRHSDAIAAIDSISHSIKWHRNRVDELIEKADAPELEFMYEPPAEPPKRDPRQMTIATEDKRPVGRPKPEAPEPAIAEGENQHLTASVNDLDLAERAKGKLIAAGLTTMGRLFEVIEQDGGEVKLEEVANVTTAVAGSIVKAARSWQKAHRKAAHAVEKEALLGGNATL